MPVTVASNCSLVPVATEALSGLTVTTTTGTMLTLAEADSPGSATLVAVTFTVAGEGATEGAEYTADEPLVETVPHREPLQPAPVTLHLTAEFELPGTLALKVCVPAVGTEAVVGLTPKATVRAATTVMDAEADFIGSATLVALTVTIPGEGTLAGEV